MVVPNMEQTFYAALLSLGVPHSFAISLANAATQEEKQERLMVLQKETQVRMKRFKGMADELQWHPARWADLDRSYEFIMSLKLVPITGIPV